MYTTSPVRKCTFTGKTAKAIQGNNEFNFTGVNWITEFDLQKLNQKYSNEVKEFEERGGDLSDPNVIVGWSDNNKLCFVHASDIIGFMNED